MAPNYPNNQSQQPGQPANQYIQAYPNYMYDGRMPVIHTEPGMANSGAVPNVTPNFVNSVNPTTQNVANPAETNFNVLETGNLGNPVHYNNLSTVVENAIGRNENASASIELKKLIDNSNYREPYSVGLSMKNSIIKESSKDEAMKLDENKEEDLISAKFTSLVKEDPRNITHRFGVQSIPIEEDRSMLPKPITIADTITANAHLNKDAQPSGKKISNWFTRLLDQRGQDYISSGKLTIDEVSKNAERIIDDMIAGRIDYDKFGQYIIMPTIIETLINYCSNKLAINKAIQYSLGYIYNDYTNRTNINNTDIERCKTLYSIDDSLARNITQSIAIVNQDLNVYGLLYDRLSYVNATKNASSLFSLTNDLNNYKKQMRKRY